MERVEISVKIIDVKNLDVVMEAVRMKFVQNSFREVCWRPLVYRVFYPHKVKCQGHRKKHSDSSWVQIFIKIGLFYFNVEGSLSVKLEARLLVMFLSLHGQCGEGAAWLKSLFSALSDARENGSRGSRKSKYSTYELFPLSPYFSSFLSSLSIPQTKVHGWDKAFLCHHHATGKSSDQQRVSVMGFPQVTFFFGTHRTHWEGGHPR